MKKPLLALLLAVAVLTTAAPSSAAPVRASPLKSIASVSPLSERALQQAYATPIVPPGFPLTAGLDPRQGVSTAGFWSWQDYPGYVPPVTPTAVSVFVNASSNNLSATDYPPMVNTNLVALPAGSFSKILLRVDVALASAVPGRPGVNYDRALWIFVDGVPMLIGTTAQRFNYTVTVDVTHLYPLLVGGAHNFTLILNNWVIPTLGLTGYFLVNATLLYYPGAPPPDAPDLIVPLWNASGISWVSLRASSPVAWQVSTVPGNAIQAFLYLYAEGASYDEFWWANIPTDRFIVVASDGKQIAVAQAFPYIYTGGIMPFLWRPVPEIDTYAFHPIVVDVTPYLPFIVGTHNFTITVTNNMNYWLVGGFLALKLSSQPVSYSFLGDSPSLQRSEGTASVGQATAYSVRGVYSNTARLSISVGGSAYIYATTYSVGIVAVQSYDSVWWNTSVSQWWCFNSSWLANTITACERSDLEMKYSEMVTPQGDISKASVSNPVPATDVLSVTIRHSYVSQGSKTYGGIRTTLTTKQAVFAAGSMSVSLLFISPTGAIITAINSVFARNEKSTYSDLYLGASQIYRYGRLTAGGTNFPPLSYVLYRDIVSVYVAR